MSSRAFFLALPALQAAYPDWDVACDYECTFTFAATAAGRSCDVVVSDDYLVRFQRAEMAPTVSTIRRPGVALVDVLAAVRAWLDAGELPRASSSMEMGAEL